MLEIEAPLNTSAVSGYPAPDGSGLIRQFGGLPGHHAPRIVPLGVNIDELDLEFYFMAICVDVDIGVASDRPCPHIDGP